MKWRSINVIKFTPQDISCASYVTKLTWGDEMALTNDGLKDVLYEAMVRYYYRSKAFSLKMTDEEGMQGFLLAAPLSERDNSQSWLKQNLQHFECEEQDLVYDYLRYLSYNGRKIGIGESGGFTAVFVFEHEKRCGQQAVA